MRKSITFIKVALSFLIALSVALVPVKSIAAEPYGYVGTFTGDIQFSSASFTLPLHFAYSNVEHYGDGTVNPSSERVVYSGGFDGNLKITGTPGTYLNGSVFTYFTFTHQGTPSGVVHLQGDYMNSGNISMFTKSTYINTNESCVLLLVQFNNYELTSDTIELPIYFNVSFTTNLSTVDQYVDDYIWLDVVTDEWYDQLTEYTDIRDLPGHIGDEAKQNQQIIDGIDQNTSAVTATGNNIVSGISDAATYIGNQIKYYIELLETSVTSNFNKLTTNLTNWYNGLVSNLNTNFDRLLNQNTEEHEETINGYQGTGTPEASEKFDQSAGELDSIESDLTGITNTSVDNYATAAFDTSIITTLGPSLVYVVTWFTNFWNMGGIFTSLLNVGLALFVAFFILRLHGGK